MSDYDFELVLEKLAGRGAISASVLRRAKSHAERLAPYVASGLELRRQGNPFKPGDRDFLLRSLYACAAASRRELWPTWVNFLKVDRETFEDLFGLLDEDAVARVTLSLIAPDEPSQIDAVFDLLKDKTLFWAVRDGLWLALGRLTAAGVVDRQRTLALFDAYPAYLTDCEDYSLAGWTLVALCLGLEDRLELIKQTRSGSCFLQRLHPFDAYEAALREARLKPAVTAFDECGVTPLSDPADGLDRLRFHERNVWQRLSGAFGEVFC